MKIVKITCNREVKNLLKIFNYKIEEKIVCVDDTSNPSNFLKKNERQGISQFSPYGIFIIQILVESFMKDRYNNYLCQKSF